MLSVVVLISGAGSNLRALLDAANNPLFGARIVAVGADNPADGLAHADLYGIPTFVVSPTNFASREAWADMLLENINFFKPDLVVLAGFMRILGEPFVQRYEGRLLNIHPSLLPAFPGLDTHARAIAAGVRLHGATVHFVTPQLDQGPIVIQAAVPVMPDDDAQQLAARVLAQEHRIYPRAVQWFCDGRLRIQDGRVEIAALSDGCAADAALLVP